jgi:hypothetical protein
VGWVADDPFDSGALILNRDGIVGHWEQPGGELPHLKDDKPANLRLWSREVRATLFEFETLTRLAFAKPRDGEGYVVYHGTLGSEGARPNATYLPLVTLIRPDENKFREQLAKVRDYADLRADRVNEVLAQIGPLARFLGSIAFLRPERSQYTLELLHAAHRFIYYVEQRFKHALACRRPQEHSPQVQPMIVTPGHGSLPSGHATEAFGYAHVLWRLLEASDNAIYKSGMWREQLLRQAARIAINRTVAGVHFPVDSAAGAVLGLSLAEYFVARCTGGGYRAWTFNGGEFPGERDFEWRAISEAVLCGPQNRGSVPCYMSPEPDATSVDRSPMLGWLWSQATKEWAMQPLDEFSSPSTGGVYSGV